MNKVCGLVFSPYFAEVVLIQTPHGLTGIEGPASKEDRRVRDTMSRIGKDQCGLEIAPEEWTLFAEFLKPDKTDGERTVYFFHNTHRYKEAQGEGINTYAVPDTVAFPTRPLQSRLRWLILLAAHWGEQDLDVVMLFDKSARSRRKQ